MHVPEITDRFLLRPETEEISGYKNDSLKRLEDAGLFPKRIRLSSTKTVWRYSEVMAWFEDKSDRRDELAALHAPANAVKRKEAATA